MRNGETIWWCKRVSEDNAEAPTYERPQALILKPPTPFSPIGITCQPRNGHTDYLEYGETTNSDQRIICQPYKYWEDKFHKGDKFYIDGAKPSANEDFYGQEANYYAEFVAKQNEVVVISLKQVEND